VFGDSRSECPQDNPGNIFQFLDTFHSLGLTANVNWRHSFTNRLSGTANYTFSRQSNTNVPFFAKQSERSGNAGITGKQSGAGELRAAVAFFRQRNYGIGRGGRQFGDRSYQTGAVNYSMLWSHGRHQLQYGGDYKRLEFNAFSQQNPRGNFSLRERPPATTSRDSYWVCRMRRRSRSVMQTNISVHFVRWLSIDDDGELSPGFTLKLGLRWEYNRRSRNFTGGWSTWMSRRGSPR